MKSSLSAEKINFEDFEGYLRTYEQHVPSGIQGLEDLRLRDVPEVLEQRRKDGNALLEKTDITGLVEWKLKHGTYRPNLLRLVASNSVQEIRKTTKNAFAIYETDNTDFAKCITALSKLKGIGPATASLFLSCYDPEKVPFFADELFRYVNWSDAKSKGSDRKINYTLKEYKDMYEKVRVLRERLEKESGQTVTAIDIEKMAYALVRGAQNNNGISGEDEKPLQPPAPKRRKRKSPEPDTDPTSICLGKGPLGSPTYDRLGYELDYEYISKHCTGRPRPLGKRALARLDQKEKECERKVEIMGMPKHDGVRYLESAWDDRVAKDLKLAYHEVGIEEYEKWHAKGFRATREDFENPSEKEKKRLENLMTGCALRKGSKHR